jgi:hypothetical protein
MPSSADRRANRDEEAKKKGRITLLMKQKQEEE